MGVGRGGDDGGGGKSGRGLVRDHRDLDVYRLAFRVAMQIVVTTGVFPVEERYGLTSQMRRASRSVCASIAEAWRKRRYERAFVSPPIPITSSSPHPH